MASKVKKAKKERTPTFEEKFKNLLKAMVISFIKLSLHIIAGIICLQLCRSAQANFLPGCVSTKPYTDKDVEMDHIHMDYITTSRNGKDMSIKANYPLKENLNIFHGGYISRTIRDWTQGPQATKLTYWFGTCMAAGVSSAYSSHTRIYEMLNAILPVWVIMFFSFLIIPIVFHIVAIWSVINFVITSIAKWDRLTYLKEVYQAGPHQKSRWKKDDGIWDWPSTKWTVATLVFVIFGLPLWLGAGCLFAIVSAATAVMTMFYAKLYYSKKSEIDQVMNAQQVGDVHNPEDNSPGKDQQVGGGEDSDNKDD
jgi:hypothetical protein